MLRATFWITCLAFGPSLVKAAFLGQAGSSVITESTWVSLGSMLGAISVTAFLVSRWGGLIRRLDRIEFMVQSLPCKLDDKQCPEDK